MIGPHRVFDTHTHIGYGLHHGRRVTADDLLRNMDRVGIDRSLVIPFPAVEDVRAAHGEIAAAVRAHPDRLTGCACVPPWSAGSSDEVRRCAGDLGFRALKLQPQFHALNPLSPRSDRFFETALEHNLTLVVHTGAGAPLALLSLYIKPARKFPELRIVLAHAGGGIYVGEAIVAAEVCPNIYVELSSLMPHHVSEVMRHVDSSRLLIGSDLLESARAEIAKIVELDAAADVKDNILWRTAETLFG